MDNRNSEGNQSMDAVRRIMDASSLVSVMSLPESFKNRKLEVIVRPVEKIEESNTKVEDIEKAIQSLVGSVPYTDMSLSELREERLRKYIS